MPDIIYLNRCLGERNGPRKYIATDRRQIGRRRDGQGDKVKNKIILEKCRCKLSSRWYCIEV